MLSQTSPTLARSTWPWAAWSAMLWLYCTLRHSKTWIVQNLTLKILLGHALNPQDHIHVCYTLKPFQQSSKKIYVSFKDSNIQNFLEKVCMKEEIWKPVTKIPTAALIDWSALLSFLGVIFDIIIMYAGS